MKWTQEDLAHRVGVTRQTIIAIENGKGILSKKDVSTRHPRFIYIFDSSTISGGSSKSNTEFNKVR